MTGRGGVRRAWALGVCGALVLSLVGVQVAAQAQVAGVHLKAPPLRVTPEEPLPSEQITVTGRFADVHGQQVILEQGINDRWTKVGSTRADVTGGYTFTTRAPKKFSSVTYRVKARGLLIGITPEMDASPQGAVEGRPDTSVETVRELWQVSTHYPRKGRTIALEVTDAEGAWVVAASQRQKADKFFYDLEAAFPDAGARKWRLVLGAWQGVARKIAETGSMEVTEADRPDLVGPDLPTAVVGHPYRIGLLTSDARAGDWSVASGAVPGGMKLTYDGYLTGTPTQAGTSTFVARLTGDDGVSGTRSFDLAVVAQTPASCSTPKISTARPWLVTADGLATGAAVDDELAGHKILVDGDVATAYAPYGGNPEHDAATFEEQDEITTCAFEFTGEVRLLPADGVKFCSWTLSSDTWSSDVTITWLNGFESRTLGRGLEMTRDADEGPSIDGLRLTVPDGKTGSLRELALRDCTG